MGLIGMQELLVIAAVALLFFGPRQLPKLGRAAGEAAREVLGIKKTLDETREELQAELTRDVKL